MSLCGEIENIEYEIKQLLKTLEDKQAYLRNLKLIEKGVRYRLNEEIEDD